MNDRRLEKVLQALSRRERALLFLREYKDGTNQDPGAVAFLAAKERHEYARLIDVIRFCNGELADIVLIVREQVTTEEMRFNALRLMVKPVTEVEAKARKRAPKCGFDVRDPDEAAVLKEDRQLALKLTARGYRLTLPFDLAGEISADPKNGAETVRLIAATVRDNLASYWKQLKAVDVVLAECAEEFDGEDPLKPQLRAYLDDALKRTEACKDELLEYIGDWELPDDLGEALALTRKLGERALN